MGSVSWIPPWLKTLPSGQHLCQVSISSRSWALSTSHHREHHPTGYSAPVLPWRKEEPPFADGCFDVLALYLLEGVHVRRSCEVRALSAPEANTSQEDLVVHRTELKQLFRAECLHHTHVQQGLDHLGLHPADFQSKRGGVISYNSGPNRLTHAHVRRIRRSTSSVDVSAFVDNSIHMLYIYTSKYIMK